MLNIRRLTLLYFVAALGGCGTMPIPVHSDFDNSADFSNYRTFSFISDKPLMVANIAATNPMLEGRLVEATKEELAVKGFRYVRNRTAADFVVSFTLGARDKIRVNSYPTNYRGGYYGGWATPYHNEVDVRNYTEGTIAIDLFDVAKKSPVWHGWAIKSITAQDRANPAPLVKEIVSSIMAQFPPNTGS
jgi:hypothetical protein